MFRRPNPRLYVDVMPLHCIVQVNEVKLLGVIFTNNLRFDLHVDFILKTCSQRSYIIRRFRDQGLAIKHAINHCLRCYNTVAPYVCVASLVWILSQELIYRIDVFLRRMCKFGLCQHIYNFQYMSLI